MLALGGGGGGGGVVRDEPAEGCYADLTHAAASCLKRAEAVLCTPGWPCAALVHARGAGGVLLRQHICSAVMSTSHVSCCRQHLIPAHMKTMCTRTAATRRWREMQLFLVWRLPVPGQEAHSRFC